MRGSYNIINEYVKKSFYNMEVHKNRLKSMDYKFSQKIFNDQKMPKFLYSITKNKIRDIYSVKNLLPFSNASENRGSCYICIKIKIA
jgi:hypothetical protein